MIDFVKPDNVDGVLRQALRDRPEPRVAGDLAARALAMGRQSADALGALSRVRRWNRLFTTLAAVLIMALGIWILHARLVAGGFQTWTDTTSVGSTISDSSTTTDGSTTAMEWMFAGAAMAVGAVVVVMTQRAMGVTDEWMALPQN